MWRVLDVSLCGVKKGEIRADTVIGSWTVLQTTNARLAVLLSHITVLVTNLLRLSLI